MQFREWLLNEMPMVRLNRPENMQILAGDEGYLHPQPVTADFIDMRFEDYKKFGRQPPQVKSGINATTRFAAPLANGDWLNVTLNDPIAGSGTITSRQPQAYSDETTGGFRLYPTINEPDWASFAEFLNHYMVTKAARTEAERAQSKTG